MSVEVLSVLTRPQIHNNNKCYTTSFNTSWCGFELPNGNDDDTDNSMEEGWSTLFLLDKGTDNSEVTSPTSHAYRSDALTSFLILFADWILQSRLANPVLCHGRRLMLPAHPTGQQNETLSWNTAVSAQSRLLIWKVGEYNPLAVHLLLTTPYTQWMWDGQSHKQC